MKIQTQIFSLFINSKINYFNTKKIPSTMKKILKLLKAERSTIMTEIHSTIKK